MVQLRILRRAKCYLRVQRLELNIDTNSSTALIAKSMMKIYKLAIHFKT